MKKNFSQNQKVMIRRIGDGAEYRAKVVGVSSIHPECDFYIVELIDKLPSCGWTHVTMVESCLDAENW